MEDVRSRRSARFVALATLASCSQFVADRTGRSCQPGECSAGFACHPELLVCAVSLDVGCTGPGEYCPSRLTTGEACPYEFSFVPCDDALRDCSAGCRTCGSDLTWSECSRCQRGQLQSCSDCFDDCSAQVLHATPACVSSGTGHACDYAGACEAGWGDADGDRTNGCECAATNGGIEVCDGRDNDCSGQVDDGLSSCQCTLGTPTSEICDGQDNDCNESIDDVTDIHADCNSQLGNPPEVAQFACATGSCDIFSCNPGSSDANGDPTDGCEAACTLSNGGLETCDGQDNDCDGTPDNAGATGCSNLFWDADGDGFGLASDTQCLCATRGSYVATVGGDCDDDNVAGCGSDCNPGVATDVCDGYDTDCDTGGTALATEIDHDADGFIECTGYVEHGAALIGGGDCNDNPLTCGANCFPGANEVCDGFDTDCNSGGIPASTEIDNDSDGYVECAGYLDRGAGPIGGDDCDDAVSSCGSDCYPGAPEVCDGFDTNCDNGGVAAAGEIDDDQDGYLPCAGYIDHGGPFTGGGDCDDDDDGGCGSDCFPGAVEVCDGYDTDCSTGGTPVDTEVDNDGDGYVECAGYVEHGAGLTGGADCDDDDAGGCGSDCFPGAAEVCDGYDTDCSTGGTPVDTEVDNDGDGYVDCVGYVEHGAGLGGGDCDDDVSGCGASCSPAVIENTAATNCGDKRDNDCDGRIDCSDVSCNTDASCTGCTDGDGDGYTLCGPTPDCDDVNAPPNCGSDCYPGALEVCDGFDTDCSSLGLPTSIEVDDDGDGYVDCVGYVEHGAGLGGGDCDDDVSGCGASCSPAVNENNAATNCDDDSDNDCDGRSDCSDLSCAADATCAGCSDVDGDTWPDCGPTPDCDDAGACGALCNPGLVEEQAAGNCADAYDNDCDGALNCVDAGCMANATCVGLGCQDADGNGWSDCGGTGDCDDTLAACTDFCGESGDADGVPDCVEVACGTDPDSDASTCTVVDTAAALPDPIPAGGTVLLGSFSTDSEIEILAGATITQRAGGVITDTGGNRVFDIDGDNVTIDGVHINAAGRRSPIHIDGNNATITNCTIEDHDRAAVEIDGATGTTVSNNLIVGGSGGGGNDRGGVVVLRGSSNVTIVGNVIVQNNHDGIHVNGASGITIDHNTIADNTGDGVRFRGNVTTGICMRNNVITGHSGAGDVALDVSVGGTTWNAAASCQANSGNNVFGNSAQCGGGSCGACSCLPDPSVWSSTLDPAFTSAPQTLGDAEFYCSGETALIDVGQDLGYDLNGDDPGAVTGLGPDIGGREAGSEGCP